MTTFYMTYADRWDVSKAVVKALPLSTVPPLTALPLCQKRVMKRATDSLPGASAR
jgi:hypothetical protein